MNRYQSLIIIWSFFTAMLLIMGCRKGGAPAVPNGQVKGILVDEEGHPFPSNEVDVMLATIPDEASDKIVLNTSWQSPVDDSGAFLIENVPPGKYCLVLFFKRRLNFGVVLKEDERFTFEMAQKSGIDLGRVNASQVRLF